VAQLRVPPHSIEAESSVLGGLLLDSGAWDRVGDLLEESDFFRYEHRLIFSAIAALSNASKPVDIFTVFDRLQRLGKHEEASGLAYLNSLTQYVPSASNIRRYAEIVRERSILRKVVAACDETATAAFNVQDKSVDKILDEAEQRIFNIALSRKGSRDDDWQEPDAAMVEFLKAVQDRSDGQQDFISTGLRDVDEKLDGGMRPGDVIVIAGRPGMGKSALALSIGEHAAREHHAVGILTLEMTKAALNRRRVTMHSHVPLHKIKRPNRMNEYDWSQMTRSVDDIRSLPVYISEHSSPTINQVRTKARNLKRRHGLRVLVIDYIGLMEGTDRKADRRIQLGEVSRGVKALAKELGISILLLAQLNRDVEKRPNMRPIMSDLRESGDIEQDADVILFVHRPIQARPDLADEWKPYAELVIGKQRDGETGVVPLRYIGEAVTFEDWPLDRPVPTSKVVAPKPVSRGMEDE
jgi:replicative DNA helicase